MKFAFVQFARYFHILSFSVVAISEQGDYIFGHLLHLQVSQNRINNWELSAWIFTTETCWKQFLMCSKPLYKTHILFVTKKLLISSLVFFVCSQLFAGLDFRKFLRLWYHRNCTWTFRLFLAQREQEKSLAIWLSFCCKAVWKLSVYVIFMNLWSCTHYFSEHLG